jgi:hypothetical protein
MCEEQMDQIQYSLLLHLLVGVEAAHTTVHKRERTEDLVVVVVKVAAPLDWEQQDKVIMVVVMPGLLVQVVVVQVVLDRLLLLIAVLTLADLDGAGILSVLLLMAVQD